MLEKIKTGWEIFKISMGIMYEDKRLLLLGLFITILNLSIWYFLLKGFGITEELATLWKNTSTENAWESFFWHNALWFFIILLISGFAANMLQAVITQIVYATFKQTRITLSEAFNKAFSRIGGIAAWSFYDNSIIFTLNLIQEWLDEHNLPTFSFLFDMVEGVWRFVSQLALPIIVLEKDQPGAKEGLTRSWSLFKSTWGENVTGSFSFSILSLLIMIPSVLLALPLFMAGKFVSGMFVIIGGMVIVQVLSHTLLGIWRTTLYLYATEQLTPKPFADADLSLAFTKKHLSSLT